MRSLAPFLVVAAAACGNAPPPPAPSTSTSTSTPTPTPTPTPTSTSTSTSTSTPTPTSTPTSPVYSTAEAVRDALASPLTLVGVGGSYGYFRHLSCVYKNAQVIVIDVRCNDPETYQLYAVIEAPGRGRVQIEADAKNKTVALSTTTRAGYEVFSLSGAGPSPGSPPLSLAMSYDEIYAHEDQIKFQGGCERTMRLAQPVCSARAAYTPQTFAAANDAFFDAPPDTWSAFVKTLVAARKASYAATDLSKASAGQLAAWASAVGFKHDIDVAEQMLPFVGQKDRFAAAVATDDGGMAYAGTRRGAQAVVARTDRTGAQKWEAVLAEPSHREEGDVSLVAAPDGFYVHAKGWVDPSLKARHRLIKLDPHGKVQWKWTPKDRGPIAIPQFFRGGLTPQGTVIIDGYIQTEKDGSVLGWTAEVTADGKTVREEIGSADLGKKNSLP